MRRFLPSFVLVITSSLALSVAGCEGDTIDFTLAVDRGETPTPSFRWDTDPARELGVFRCAADCPATDALPSDHGPVAAEGLTLVWKLEGLSGVEAGEGVIPSPVTFGAVPTGAGGTRIDAIGDATVLAPGNYAVRVVLSRGSVVKAEWGVRWATFRVGA